MSYKVSHLSYQKPQINADERRFARRIGADRGGYWEVMGE